MELPKGISVCCQTGAVYVRVVGRGTFQNGQPLRRYALEMIEKGATQCIVDLGPCDGMDSTFLGVLAGIGLRLNKNNGRDRMRVANVSNRNLELLQTLGLDRLFVIAASSPEGPAADLFQRLPDSDIAQFNKPLNKNDTADLMLEAHDNLIQADTRNLAKFKDLTTFLRDRVEKRDPEPTAGKTP
ncbi:MAG: STAS domain-containing protein [Verrucomicrobiota bacterium]